MLYKYSKKEKKFIKHIDRTSASSSSTPDNPITTLKELDLLNTQLNLNKTKKSLKTKKKALKIISLILIIFAGISIIGIIFGNRSIRILSILSVSILLMSLAGILIFFVKFREDPKVIRRKKRAKSGKLRQKFNYSADIDEEVSVQNFEFMGNMTLGKKSSSFGVDGLGKNKKNFKGSEEENLKKSGDENVNEILNFLLKKKFFLSNEFAKTGRKVTFFVSRDKDSRGRVQRNLYAKTTKVRTCLSIQRPQTSSLAPERKMTNTENHLKINDERMTVSKNFSDKFPIEKNIHYKKKAAKNIPIEKTPPKKILKKSLVESSIWTPATSIGSASKRGLMKTKRENRKEKGDFSSLTNSEHSSQKHKIIREKFRKKKISRENRGIWSAKNYIRKKYTVHFSKGKGMWGEGLEKDEEITQHGGCCWGQEAREIDFYLGKGRTDLIFE